MMTGSQTFIIGAVGTADDSVNPITVDPSYIDFGGAGVDNAQDVAVFTADFGTVQIDGFGDWVTNEPNLGEQDILDFTALGVDELSDLTITQNGANVDITSSLFDGTVVILGRLTTDLSNENFDFVA